MKQYKFIGSTTQGMGFVNGHVYDLDVVERSRFDRVIDRVLPPFVPTSWRVFIKYPRFVPYTSMETFRENWHELDAVDIFAQHTRKFIRDGGLE